MKELVVGALSELITGNEHNWSDTLSGRYFEAPVVGFASGDDPLFRELKEIIGPWHRTPREAFQAAFRGEEWQGGTVISWAMPWSDSLRDCHRRRQDLPSKEWTRAYHAAKRIQKEVRGELVQILARHGWRGLAPADADWFEIVDGPDGKSSPWSERHVAYAAGLGTFGLNRGFITEKGMAVAVNSVIVDAVLSPDRRAAPHHLANCLYFANGSCGACVRRCPTGAISSSGHDKNRCMIFGYGPDAVRLGAERGVDGPAGCALCAVGVPCESRNPVRILSGATAG